MMRSILHRIGTTFAALAVFVPGLTHAHTGEPHGLRQAWTLDPAVLVPMALFAVLYGSGVFRLWHRAGMGRGVRFRQAACFVGGMAALFGALVWPLDGPAGALFSAHMAQHMVLTVVAAPLLVLSAPPLPLLLVLPARWRRAFGGRAIRPPFRPIWRRLASLPAATLLQALALWFWHAPSAFEAALASDFVHFGEHATLLATALLFWWALARSGDPARPGLGAGALCALVTLMHCGLLGALITFAPSPLYAAYGDSAAEWGLSPLEDQQLAGLIMWIPVGCVYLGAGLALFANWLRRLEERNARRAGPFTTAR